MPNKNEYFSKWLHDKLNELQIDADVFGNYISGIIMTEDETREEKSEALQELLSEIIENDLQKIVCDILDKWEECANKNTSSANNATGPSIDVEVQLAKLLEAQKLKAILPERKYTEEERRIKEQILAQYAQTEIQEEEDFENGTGEAAEQQASGSGGIERNTNVQDVIQLQKEKREQARLDSAAKKLKDKEDREKQRQLREDKKEKRKTVKGERRR